MAAESHVKSAERVLEIFEGLAATPSGQSFTSLQQSLGIPKSSLHALLDVLTARGYLEFEPATRLYTVGIRLWERGQAYQRHHGLVQEALPAMERIVAAINETAQLAVLDGLENVYLAKVDSSHPLRLQSEVGKRLVAYATGLGKTLLAHLGADDLASRLRDAPLRAFTPTTLADLGELTAELGRIGERGFGVDNQEYTPGLCCVAVPIMDHRGRCVASVSVSVPLTRASLGLLAEALALLAEASLSITRRLGGREDDARLLALAQPGAAAQALLALEQAPALGLHA
jgi:DNA-binding IclR family transcriptional regulator